MLYGVVLGLAAGIAPGPLLTLVISETLKGNRLNGILIALAPLITDLPIILISIYLLKSLSNTGFVLSVLSFLGGIFLIYLGIQNFRFNPETKSAKSDYHASLRYGVIANLLSPHPYIFWITIGAPTFIKASEVGTYSSLAFTAGFYLLLIGSKIIIAIISGVAKNLIQSIVYTFIMKLMGAILLILAVLLILDGYRLLMGNAL